MILEKLGIPDNLIESAKKLFDETLINLDNQYETLSSKDEIYYEVNNIEISEYKVNSVFIKFQTIVTDQTDKPLLSGMSILTNYGKKSIKTIEYKKSDVIKIIVNIYVNENNNKSDIINFFTDKKVKIISSFAHELKHYYDFMKKSVGSIKSEIDYIQTDEFRLGVETLNEFFYYLYYSHSVENLVRATEVGAYIKISDVKKKDFLDFIKSNDVYKNLEKMSNFNINDFYNGLIKDMDQIIDVLKYFKIEIGTNEENIKKILDIVLTHTFNTKVETFNKHLNRIDPLVLFFNEHEAKEVFDDLKKTYKKYEKNPIKFFEDKIKYIKFVGDKYKKKVIKLYDLIEDEPLQIHNKINKRISNFKKFNNER